MSTAHTDTADVEPRWADLLRLDVSTYILGGALLFYGRGTILLLVVLFGYLKRVVEFDGSDETVPSFDDWAALLADGTRLLVVWLVYFVALPLLAVLLVERGLLTEGLVGEIIPVVGTVTLALLTGAVEGTLVSSEEGTQVINMVVVGGTSYSLASVEPVVLFLVAAYVYPAAVLRYTAEGSLWAAFSFKSLKSHVKSPRYALQWGVFTGLSLLALFLLVQVDTWADALGDWVWTISGRNILLSNEVGELAVFVVSVVSFQLFVLAHYALGRRRLPPWWDRVAVFVTRHDTDLARVVLGGVLLSLGIIPSLVLVLGYLSRAFDHARSGREGLPPFRPWRDTVDRGARLLVAWVGLVSIPWAVLLFGQYRRGIAPERLTARAVDPANALVGMTALPVGPPLAYQLDRGIGDVLRILALAPPQPPPRFPTIPRLIPYGVGDPTRLPLDVIAAFTLLLLLAWFTFTLVVVAVSVSRSREESLRRTVSAGLLSARVSLSHWRALAVTVCWWVVGGVPLVWWYVWRRGAISNQELISLGFAPLGLSFPIPNPFSLVSILFLFTVSLWNFYALTKAYRWLGTSVARCDAQA